MPTCRNCNSRIDKFNRDRCPICGAERPFDGTDSDTIEITTNIDTSNINVEYNPKKKKTFLILFALLGAFGVPFFYINKKKQGFIYALINVVVIAASITSICLLTTIHPALVFVLILFVAVVVNAIIGLFIYNTPNLKDGNGEFLA